MLRPRAGDRGAARVVGVDEVEVSSGEGPLCAGGEGEGAEE